MPSAWENIKVALEKAGYRLLRRTTEDVEVFENREGCVITVGLGVVAGRKIVDGKVHKSEEYPMSAGSESVDKVVVEMNGEG